jgi:hypothetical protein
MSSSGYDDYDGSMVADASLHPPIHGCMPPSLKLLRHPAPSRILHHCNVGLLRCRGPKGDGFYVIASLLYASFVPGRYDLYTYDSRTEEWATKMALLRQEQELGLLATPPLLPYTQQGDHSRGKGRHHGLG